MKHTLIALAIGLSMGLASVAQAESPVGMGKTNMQLDSTPCYSWGGNGAFWTRCPAPVPVQQVSAAAPKPPAPVIVEKIVEKPVEKIVYVERKPKGE